MPKFIKETNSSLRVEETKVDIVEISDLKMQREYLSREREAEITRHTDFINNIDTKLSRIDSFLQEAKNVGIDTDTIEVKVSI